MEEFVKEQAKALGELTRETGAEVLKPSATTIGSWLSAKLYNRMGDEINRADLRRIEHAANKQAFLDKCMERLGAIPPEKLIRPKEQLLLGAVFDAEFVMDEELLREMFANLIASAANSDTTNDVHPRFSDIIRHMSSKDAQLLLELRYLHPIRLIHCSYNLLTVRVSHLPEAGYRSIYIPTFKVSSSGGPRSPDELNEVLLSVDSLISNGILAVSTGLSESINAVYTDDNGMRTSAETLLAIIRDLLEEPIDDMQLVISHAYFTELGRKFIQVCT